MKKVVLLTGASSGLGKMLAEHLSANGYLVYGGVREPRALKSDSIKYIKLDITSDSNVALAIKKIITEQKRIDILINCAGLTKIGQTVEFSPEDYKELLDINAIGAFRLIRQVVPFMKKRKTGAIINITSLNGIVSFPNFGLYSSSKFALDALSTALHYELKKYGINVTSVAPGAIYNPNVDISKMPHKPAREKFIVLKLLLPMVTQEEISHAICRIIQMKNVPSRVILGRDAKVVHTINRVIPSKLWNKLMFYVWSR